MISAAIMNVSDDSDEDIFDATRPILGCESISTLIKCTEDETHCEVLQLIGSQNGETHCALESAMPSCCQIQHTDSDCDCKQDLKNTDHPDTTIPASSGLAECESSVGVGLSLANVDYDDTGQTTDSFTRTDYITSNSCLIDADATEVIGSNQTAESVNSCVCPNVSEQDDELLAELENEFNCMTAVRSDSMSSDCHSTNGPVSPHIDSASDDDLPLAFASLQRRQGALECRLQNTLEARKQLELENTRLECKLSSTLEALEASKQDLEAAKLQV